MAEREETVLAPDRNSYSVKNMTAASGGTAIDVLRNIPLVEVDGSNNVSLRGNANVVVQINGRSTPLKGDQLGAFLAQLPAGTVKNVEVATNPSAKDDPEGTAGIINIVLNQEARARVEWRADPPGLRRPGRSNANGNIGKQQGKLTMFASGSMYHDQRVDVGQHLADESRHPGAGVQRDETRRKAVADLRRRNAALGVSVHASGTRCRSTASSMAATSAAIKRRTTPISMRRAPSSGCSTSASSQTLAQPLAGLRPHLPAAHRQECAAVLDGARVLEQHNTNDIDLSGNVLQRRRVDAAGHSDRARSHARPVSVSQLEDGLHAAVRHDDEARDGPQGHASHDDERFRRRISRTRRRASSRRMPARAHGVRLPRGHRRRLRAAVEQDRQGADAGRSAARGRGDVLSI